MSAKIMTEFRSARLMVAIHDWGAVKTLAPLLYGLTDAEDDREVEDACWALERAASLVPQLRREAQSRRAALKAEGGR